MGDAEEQREADLEILANGWVRASFENVTTLVRRYGGMIHGDFHVSPTDEESDEGRAVDVEFRSAKDAFTFLTLVTDDAFPGEGNWYSWDVELCGPIHSWRDPVTLTVYLAD